MSQAIVCFVEDSDLDYEVGTMAIRLAHPEAEIVRAKCCTEGRRIIEEFVPQLIFLDLNLTRCKGFELLTHLAESYPERLRQVVVLTTSSSPNDREMALKLGASDFYTKSPDPDQYLLTVRQIASKLLS
ncbi:Transcriptional regulatory protein DegU [Bremerella volcania]|uniref:Transcriptional regulatory protein DegU n=1 Tax=Bremerella volcania TaxID=2527984 RepID=A0A518C373_9BACT|nr:response regulator [Bremerella volcania]QDU73675.1 Transcriptional regulatory protein DegU [Bremerella volcania]